MPEATVQRRDRQNPTTSPDRPSHGGSRLTLRLTDQRNDPMRSHRLSLSRQEECFPFSTREDSDSSTSLAVTTALA